MKREDMLVGMFIGLFIVTLSNIYIGVAESESCKMYNDMWNDTVKGMAGFYDIENGDYYCVWTKGQSVESISDTENHEIAHLLVDRKYKHFCGG